MAVVAAVVVAADDVALSANLGTTLVRPNQSFFSSNITALSPVVVEPTPLI